MQLVAGLTGVALTKGGSRITSNESNPEAELQACRQPVITPAPGRAAAAAAPALPHAAHCIPSRAGTASHHFMPAGFLDTIRA